MLGMNCEGAEEPGTKIKLVSGVEEGTRRQVGIFSNSVADEGIEGERRRGKREKGESRRSVFILPLTCTRFTSFSNLATHASSSVCYPFRDMKMGPALGKGR